MTLDEQGGHLLPGEEQGGGEADDAAAGDEHRHAVGTIWGHGENSLDFMVHKDGLLSPY
jgi:hypothetical protein